MDFQFIILTRYECWKSGNIKGFSKWFALKDAPMTEKEAKGVIKETKVRYRDIDKKTKLKHEYKIIPYKDYLKGKENIFTTNLY